MLNPTLRRRRRTLPKKEGGIILLVSIVILIIMAMGTSAMLRSVSGTAQVVGNMAFQQSATFASERGIEAAITWLESNAGQTTSATAAACATGSTVLACNQPARGYIATRQDPTNTQTWASLWTTLTATTPAISAGADSIGNTSSYLIQRMCDITGDPQAGNCSMPPSSVECGQSHSTDADLPSCPLQVHYRITVRTTGPRNTVSFVQTIVAL